MRSIWSGAVSFGLINVPVKLYSATEEHAISFDLLHKKDHSPIRYARICKADGKEVPYAEIVKGYEYEKGEYVVVEEEIFKQIDRKKTSTIEIVHFAKKEEIDSIYYERPYYLEPAKGADKSFALLRTVMAQSGKVGIVKYVFRNKEHIGVIKPHLKGIILDQMRYLSEIRDMESLKLPEDDLVTKKEIEMAIKLVEQLTEKFRPEMYKDEYTEELKQAIEEKLKGGKPRVKGTVSHPSKVHDIMSLLKASLEKPKAKSKKPRQPKKAKLA